MSWVAPSTVTPGQVATAALWNEQVRDNMKVGRDSQTVASTAGNKTLNSTTLANLDTALDRTVAGAAADRLKAEFYAVSHLEAVGLYIDARTVTGSAYFSGLTVETNVGGFPGWYGLSSVQQPLSGGPVYTSVAGDYSAGNVVARLRYRTSAAANKTLFVNTDLALFYALFNLGPRVSP